jgi:DNA repair photolyase/3-methyladenine DNA glycosylase AlkC
MQQIVDRLLTRPSLEQARMAGTAVRGAFHRRPKETLASLASWSAHPNAHVRIASGIAYGVVGQRNRDVLAEILPFVERLANDSERDVRRNGAESALVRLWLAHSDAMWVLAENWLKDKNDRIREVVIHTVSRIATSGKIVRPSLLRRFVERALDLYDTIAENASPETRVGLASAIDAMGCLAPDLVVPRVLEWAQREEAGPLELVLEISRTPFGPLCEGLDLRDVQTRLAEKRRNAESAAAERASTGEGRLEYAQIVAQGFLVRHTGTHLPWSWIADPYRGCQLRCEFCNARTASEWTGDEEVGFSRRVTSVQNAAALLQSELRAAHMLPREHNVVGIGVTSDPYQPAEERLQVTRELLKTCLEAGHPVVIQTRQQLIIRDLDILEILARHGLVNVYVSMQTAIDGIRNKVELGTSSTAERLRAMRLLTSKNVPVGLLLSPIMPEVTDDPALLDETLRRAADAGASWVTSGVLDLHGSARTKVRRFLEGYAPALMDRYREIYTAGARIGDPSDEIERRITEELIPGLAAEHGLDDTSRMITSGRDAALCLVRR